MALAPDDEELTATMAGELASKALTPMEVVLQPVTVFQLTAVVQLALRHPAMPPETGDTARRFLTAVREYFADCPRVLDVIRRGDDPEEDR